MYWISTVYLDKFNDNLMSIVSNYDTNYKW